MRTLRVGGFFTGIGAHHSALERIMASRPDIKFNVIFQCEFEPKTAITNEIIKDIERDESGKPRKNTLEAWL